MTVCPALPTPSFGTKLRCPWNKVFYNTVCEFSCKIGYAGSGPKARRCQNNGTWSGREFSCEEGRKHDAAMLAESGLYNSLQAQAVPTTGQPMCIYGDPAYPLRIHLQAPYRQRVLTLQQQAYNSSMSAVRSSVE